jgi:hypothetical protein
MDTAVAVLRWIHIPFGLLGLAVFWLPLVLKKGGRAHRRVGWIFAVCMGMASVTAAALAGLRLAQNVGKSGAWSLDVVVGPLFLLNVAALTFVAVHHGITILRQKKRGEARTRMPIALAGALVGVSVVSLVVGILTGDVLLFTLPTVGLFVGSQYVWVLLKRPKDPMFWWYQHMSGMLGGCIAAITAATITNVATIRPILPLPMWAFWIGPAAIGVPVLVIWQHAYRRRFNARRTSA